ISVDDRKRRKSCSVRDAKLVVDVTEVNLHGTFGEIKLPGYHLVRVSLAQRDDNLPLAWGQCLHELLALHSTPRFALHRAVDDIGREPFSTPSNLMAPLRLPQRSEAMALARDGSAGSRRENHRSRSQADHARDRRWL